MILIYGECHGNACLTLKTYRERYGEPRVCPTNHRTILNAIQRVRENQPLIPHLNSSSPSGETVQTQSTPRDTAQFNGQ